jgi:2-octaprenyl-6-methoxyphenol hydroxylase
MPTEYDLLIIGGGLVGASLACALAEQKLHIGLVEAQPFASAAPGGYDDRSLALAYGTRRIFAGLGLWDTLKTVTTPILKIHISERGRPGFARLDHREEGVEALGYVVEAPQLGAVLTARLYDLAGVDVLCPASLEEFTIHSDAVCARVQLEGRTVSLTARLLVAADGAHSRVRRQLGIEAREWDYGQTAVSANLTPEYPHDNVAYERFTESGPLAFLPLSQGRCAVVCTVNKADKERVLGLDDDAFLAFLQDRFGDRLGRLQRIGQRRAYPLMLVKAREPVRYRVALIGNAAHTLHPVAGQGFNMGIRDVAALAEVIADAWQAGQDPGDGSVLERYADWRRWDQRRAVAFTDGLARLFTNPLLGPVRHLGLLAFDLLPPAKHALARQTMGLDGRSPRLARGLPLVSRKVS